MTFYNFVAMAAGALIVPYASYLNSLPIFVIGFILLFVFSGIGNGSTYKMIPRSSMPRLSSRSAPVRTSSRPMSEPFGDPVR